MQLNESYLCHNTQINFAFFTLNAMWLVATFTLQIFNISLSIQIPKFDLQLQYTGENIVIDPIAFMFILGFAVSVVIQFLAMLYHRYKTPNPYLVINMFLMLIMLKI